MTLSCFLTTMQPRFHADFDAALILWQTLYMFCHPWYVTSFILRCRTHRDSATEIMNRILVVNGMTRYANQPASLATE